MIPLLAWVASASQLPWLRKSESLLHSPGLSSIAVLLMMQKSKSRTVGQRCVQLCSAALTAGSEQVLSTSLCWLCECWLRGVRESWHVQLFERFLSIVCDTLLTIHHSIPAGGQPHPHEQQLCSNRRLSCSQCSSQQQLRHQRHQVSVPTGVLT